MSTGAENPPRNSTQPRNRASLLREIVLALITSATSIWVAYTQFVMPKVREQATAAAREAVAAVQVPIQTEDIQQNTLKRPIFIIGACNAANESREIEAWMGEDRTSLKLYPSATGRERISISFVVPDGWYYRVRETTGAGSCAFHGWKI